MTVKLLYKHFIEQNTKLEKKIMVLLVFKLKHTFVSTKITAKIRTKLSRNQQTNNESKVSKPKQITNLK